MHQEERTAATFDEARAARYEVKIREIAPAYDALHEAVYHVLDPQLDPEAHLLIAGAGTGAEIIRMGQRRPGWRFTAVDPSPEMLARCKARVDEVGLADRVAYVNLLMEDFAPDGAAFDAATSICISHFLQEPTVRQRYFDTIAAHLKPGAPFLFADLFGDQTQPAFEHLFQVWRAHYKAAGVPEEEVAEHFEQIEENIAFLPEAQLAKITATAGFEAIHRFYQYYLWGAWYTRKRKK